MPKNKLPVQDKVTVVSNSTTSNANPMKHETVKYDKYQIEEALSTIERAEKHKSDKGLMREVKQLAKSKIKCLDKIK